MTENGKKRVNKIASIPQKSIFHAEIDGNKSRMNLILSGVNSVKDYSDSLLLLRCRGFYIKLSGEGFRLRIFEDGTLSLDGKIMGVEMIYDRNK